jgi:hypothetical protein
VIVCGPRVATNIRRVMILKRVRWVGRAVHMGET